MAFRNPLRIAQVAPLYESVPPKLYGGTERVVHYLTEELVAQGHEVTLFASGDSRTSGRLVAGAPRSLRLDENCTDKLALHFAMLDEVAVQASEFDIIHFHVDYLHFPLSRYLGLANVTTLHGRLDSTDLVPLYRRFRDMPVVSISLAQRRALPDANWVGNVYHGLPGAANLGDGHGGYLAFLGRISPEKRPDRAIEIATAAGMKLKIAAKVDPVDQHYFESKIRPILGRPGVEYIGEIGDAEKARFLGDAYAYLFPIDWPEPFGLSMIEAMQCGTPTIAFRCGSVPEVMTDGVTGFIVSSMEEAIAAVRRVGTLDRKECRRAFTQRFTSARMAHEYVAIYEHIIAVRAALETGPAAEPDPSAEPGLPWDTSLEKV